LGSGIAVPAAGVVPRKSTALRLAGMCLCEEQALHQPTTVSNKAKASRGATKLTGFHYTKEPRLVKKVNDTTNQYTNETGIVRQNHCKHTSDA
jgi:hypothetical protein